MLLLAAPALGAATRLQRRRQQPAEHRPRRAGVRPAREGLRRRLQRPAHDRRPTCRARRHGAALAQLDSRRCSARPTCVASTPPQLNPAGDTAAIVNVYPTLLAAERGDEQPRQAPAQRRHPAGREGDRQRRDLRRRHDRDLHRLRKACSPSKLWLFIARRRRAVGAAARGRVPLARDPDPGGRDEPAVDRRGARRDRHASSSAAGGSSASPAGPDRGVPPSADVRDRVRAVDGLRGVPRVAHPRGVDAHRATRRRRCATG